MTKRFVPIVTAFVLMQVACSDQRLSKVLHMVARRHRPLSSDSLCLSTSLDN
jgi:hypothetical protein